MRKAVKILAICIVVAISITVYFILNDRKNQEEALSHKNLMGLVTFLESSKQRNIISTEIYYISFSANTTAPFSERTKRGQTPFFGYFHVTCFCKTGYSLAGRAAPMLNLFGL